MNVRRSGVGVGSKRRKGVCMASSLNDCLFVFSAVPATRVHFNRTLKSVIYKTNAHLLFSEIEDLVLVEG